MSPGCSLFHSQNEITLAQLVNLVLRLLDDSYPSSNPSSLMIRKISTMREYFDIAKTFDVLGWFAPVTIVVKILLQRVWEEKVDWDDCVGCIGESS